MEFVAQLIQYTLAVCGGISIIAGAITIIVNLIAKARKPDTERDELLKKHTEMLDRDNKRLRELEESNKIIMQSMLALMSHELDGNHREELKIARDSLQDYLIRR